MIVAEIAGREQANRQIPLKQAGFPAAKTQDNFDVAASSIPRPTFDYVASLEWIRYGEFVTGGSRGDRGTLLLLLNERRQRVQFRRA